MVDDARDLPDPQDRLLEALVELINRTEAAFNVSVTLLVHGVALSGTIVSGRQWFEHQAASFQGDESEPGGAPLRVGA